MKKIIGLALLFLLCTGGFCQHQILLYTETFDGGTNSFYIDSTGVGANTGNNDWIINNQYNGAPNYGDTKPEDSVVIGQINGAPHSNYLHIHDVAIVNGGGPSNANWNPATASDHFTYLSTPFCTLGLDSVLLTFFWICEGDSNAYGEVYYRKNGGPWVQTGQTKYANQTLWKYEVIQDTGFNNAGELQFGFRWVNSGVGVTSNESFGIDDIIAVGNYDSTANPLHMTVTLLDSNVCSGDPIYFNLAFNHPMCDANYDMQLSDASGSFATPHYMGSLALGPSFTSSYFATLNTSSITVGNCYRLRVVRTTPAPVVVSDTSTCINISTCSNIIFNVTAPVLSDPDTTCILSAIDVRFNSIGVYTTGNKYIAELSDSSGNFSTSFMLGQYSSMQAFTSLPTGVVSGNIPTNVPPGCNYFLRVRSTNPVAVSTPVGPYCLKQCDILTNHQTDLHNCIHSGPYNQCDTINIQRNHWNNSAHYASCNQWRAELREFSNFNFVADLTSFTDSTGGNFSFCLPSSANQLPVAPGFYYLRIVSTCSDQPWDSTGTVIRITIGAPDTVPPLLILNDTVFCPGEQLQLLLSPFNYPPSQYEWSSNLVNNGVPFTWLSNPLQVNLSGAAVGTYVFYARENNYGCYGPYTSPAIVHIIAAPTGQITGIDTLCPGDTTLYTTDLIDATYYEWLGVNSSQIIQTGSNQASVFFTQAGNYTLGCFMLNKCGGDTAYEHIYVRNSASCLTGINNLSVDDYNVLNIYPNPTTGQLFLTGRTDISNIEIYDLQGEKLFERNGYQNVLDISKMPDGVYFVKAQCTSGLVTQKIMLMK